MSFQQPDNRPPRTFGLIVAIVTSAIMFSFIPLIQVGMVMAIQARVGAVVATIPAPSGDDGTMEAFASGANFQGAEPARLAVQTILALTFLVIAALAWRGRMPRIRLIFSVSIVLYSTLTISLALQAALSPVDISQGIDSGTEIGHTLALLQAVTTALIMLYVLWYVNRAPARAFFRGYYLPTKEEHP
jgi:hypothetical protein